MKFLKAAVMSLIALMSTNHVFAEGTWTTYNFYNPINDILDIASYREYLWCASNQGLVRWNVINKTYEIFTFDDGLPHDTVSSVAIGPDGMVWVGTNEGLSCFNGKTWTTFTKEDGLASDKIISIAVSDKSVVWVDTWSGLSCYDGVKWETYSNSEGFPTDAGKSSLSPGPNGELWVLKSYQVYKLDGDRFVKVKVGESWWPDYYTRALAVDHDGTVWTAIYFDRKDGHPWVGEGVAYFDGDNWTQYKRLDLYQDNAVRLVTVASDGVVWFVTREDIFSFDKGIWKIYPYNMRKFRGSIRLIASGSHGEFWVSTSFGMIIRFDSDEEMIFHTGTTLGGNIYSISTGPGNELWFGTSEGVSHYNGTDWTVYTESDGLLFNTVIATAVDSAGVAWFGSSDGLTRYDGETWTIFNEENGLENPVYVNNIEIAHDGTVWVVIHKRRIGRFDGETWKIFPFVTEYEGDAIYSIAVSDDCSLWLGYYGDLIHIINDEWCKHKLPNNEGVNAVTIDSDNNVWVGTIRGDLYRYHNYNVTIFSESSGQSSCLNGHDVNTIYSIKQDPDGAMWFGTDTGLVKYDGESWTTYTKEDGLAGNLVEVITIDSRGVLWMETSGGLCSFDPLTQTFIEENGIEPEKFATLGNFPNPFNQMTTIQFVLTYSAMTDLIVYNNMGQKIRTLVSNLMPAGFHTIVWDGRDERNLPVSSGIYIAQLNAGLVVKSHCMTLVK